VRFCPTATPTFSLRWSGARFNQTLYWGGNTSCELNTVDPLMSHPNIYTYITDNVQCRSFIFLHDFPHSHWLLLGVLLLRDTSHSPVNIFTDELSDMLVQRGCGADLCKFAAVAKRANRRRRSYWTHNIPMLYRVLTFPHHNRDPWLLDDMWSARIRDLNWRCSKRRWQNRKCNSTQVKCSYFVRTRLIFLKQIGAPSDELV
jgi:hypothetical protein